MYIHFTTIEKHQSTHLARSLWSADVFLNISIVQLSQAEKLPRFEPDVIHFGAKTASTPFRSRVASKSGLRVHKDRHFIREDGVTGWRLGATPMLDVKLLHLLG